jgi:RNA polymerase sigma factor (sigma-70 family)
VPSVDTATEQVIHNPLRTFRDIAGDVSLNRRPKILKYPFGFLPWRPYINDMLTDDMALVQEYAQSNSEQAFGTLVSRHVNLVYSIALRQVRDPHLAEEITQSAFIILSRKAKSLSPKTILSGWLCRTARHISADTLKTQRRRQSREQELQMQSISSESDSAAWNQIAPLLDEALNCLEEREHDAVVLRFFDGKQLKQVGAEMGTTEDAARMRVNRGLEKLRKFFMKRGVTLSAPVITGAVAANSIQAAPVGLAATITAAAFSGTTITTTALATATKALTMTTLQKAAIATVLVATVGAGIYEGRQASNVRDEVQTLQRQQKPLIEQIERLQRENDDTARQLASLREENGRLNGATAELLRLRAEVRALRSTAGQSKQAETDPTLVAAKSWLEKVNLLKNWFEQRTEQRIPEFVYLQDYDWLDAVKYSNMQGDAAPANAAPGLREAAKRQFGHELGNALRRYAAEHDGELPTDLSQSNPYMIHPMNEDVIKSYKLLRSGKLADISGQEWLVAEIAPPFDKNDYKRVVIRSEDQIEVPREK